MTSSHEQRDSLEPLASSLFCFLQCNMNRALFRRKYDEFILLISQEHSHDDFYAPYVYNNRVAMIKTTVSFVKSQPFKTYIMRLLEDFTDARYDRQDACYEWTCQADQEEIQSMFELISAMSDLFVEKDLRGQFDRLLDSIAKNARSALSVSKDESST
jgi:hypothetical protein